jgi:hypothetical protein
MISLSECAPCKARRLQEESEREFKKRFGMVDLNRIPTRMGWRPYMGQAQPQAMFPATGAAPAYPKTYLQQAQERLLWFGTGTLFGFPIGILSNVAFKSLRRYRNEAAVFAAIASGVGLLSALLPIDSPVMLTISRVSGILAGSAMSDIVLPKKPVLIPA